MVLKEVDFLQLCIYMCVCVCVCGCVYVCVYNGHIVREKCIHYSLFTNVCKVQHCTGYPLIQVEIVSIKVTMCAGWLPKVLC